jgi:hypothetical protein
MDCAYRLATLILAACRADCCVVFFTRSAEFVCRFVGEMARETARKMARKMARKSVAMSGLFRLDVCCTFCNASEAVALCIGATERSTVQSGV